MSSIHRVFLGWDAPALRSAAAWLREQAAPASDDVAWDLAGYVLVTPGARAARRLLEILIEQAGDAALVPPDIITLGELPEQLYAPSETAAAASDLHALLSRMHALRHAPASTLERIVPHPPQDDDLAGWLALAQQLHALSQSLAGERLRVADVAPKLAAALPDFRDEPRWAALADLQQAYETLLTSRHLRDRDMARFEAIESRQCATEKQIVLIGAADLNGLIRAMLEQVADRVTALVHAPASHADAFDAFGAIIVESWRDRPLNLPDAMIRVVDQPRDQACAVLRAISQLNESQPFAADEITVGLGDEMLAPTIERTLELAGVPVHRAAGRDTSLSPPVLLLAAMARFASPARRFDDFAAMLRHGDLEAYLVNRLGAIESARHDWLTLLDEYATQTLQRKLTGAWLGDAERSRQMKRLYTAVTDLLPLDGDRRKPLGHWSQSIAQVLTAVCSRPLRRHDEHDAPLVRVLEQIGDALRDQAQLDAEDGVVPHVTFAQAIDITLQRLAGQAVPTDSPRAAVELLGSLELQLDDAPALIVTGFNEGAMPQSQTADAFLPDSMRRALGLADNVRRLARDRMAFEAIIASRPHVTLIAGRRSVEGDPLKPSRLLLMGEAATLAERIERFYAVEPDARSADHAAMLLSPGEASTFLVPPPRPCEPLERLRVTAFRDYIACPYRFYLKHIERRDAMDDAAVELDALKFGSLAHEVLSAFGESDLRNSTNAEHIAQFLTNALDNSVRRDLGEHPPVAVLLQREQLRERLVQLAQWQAQQAAAGWRIEHVERDLTAKLNIDDFAFTITGRIDRIDAHDQFGYRVIDYKSSDTPVPPDKAHRRGPRNAREWIDLQLPLYRNLVAAEGMDGEIALGYVHLPKDVQRVGFEAATWDESELASAHELACDIVRKIRAGIFWPPSEPPRFEDPFSLICMDECLSRDEAIGRATRVLRERGGDA